MIIPLLNRVLVRRKQVEERTKSGFYIPDDAKEKPQVGEVVAVGPGDWVEGSLVRQYMSVQPGDTIYFGKYAGTEIRVDDEDLLILVENDILGKEPNDAPHPPER
jgi:chaperonin GroES